MPLLARFCVDIAEEDLGMAPSSYEEVNYTAIQNYFAPLAREMLTLHDIPEHILHQVVSEAILSTQYQG